MISKLLATAMVVSLAVVPFAPQQPSSDVLGSALEAVQQDDGLDEALRSETHRV